MSKTGNNPSERVLIWAMAGLLQMNVANLQASEESGAGKQGKNQRQLEQKLALVERMLYQSPLGEQATNRPSKLDPAVYEVWLAARLAFDLAVESLEKRHGEDANMSLNSALTFYRKASALNRQAATPEVDFTALISELRSRVNGYRESLERILEEKNIQVSDSLSKNEIDTAIAAAEAYEKQGAADRAVEVLQTLQAAMESELVRIRSGETLMSGVEFKTIEEAFEYELRNNRSNEQLLELLSRNKTLSDSKQHRISQYLRESHEAGEKAMRYREEGNMEAALQALESGTVAQTQALRLFGVSI